MKMRFLQHCIHGPWILNIYVNHNKFPYLILYRKPLTTLIWASKKGRYIRFVVKSEVTLHMLYTPLGKRK